MNSSWWSSAATAAVAIVGAVCTLYLWVTRRVIREELEPIRQDIEVLRVATFNHLSHGDVPQERHIRQALGYDARTK